MNPCHAKSIQITPLPRGRARLVGLSGGHLSWAGDRWTGPTVAIVSSRIRRKTRSFRTWLAAFRSACDRIEPGTAMLTAAGAFSHRFVLHVSARREIPCIPVVVPGDSRVRVSERERQRSVTLLYDRSAAAERRTVETLPVRDRALFAIADRLLAVSVRPGGNIHRLLEQVRGARRSLSRPAIEVARHPLLTQPELHSQLRRWGCTDWRFAEPEEMPEPPRKSPAKGQLVPLPHPSQWRFLSHWTRAPRDRWPDETEGDFLEGLLSGERLAQPTPLDALLRIVSQQRVWATGEAIKGQAQVVCLTALHPSLFRTRRVFRAHRQRWDWEPFGICLGIDWLRRHGAQPVRYGDQTTWTSLSPAERPFFQACRSGDEGRNTIDWREEQEWRIVGDLDLSTVSRDEVMLFVRTRADAERAAAVTEWPITILER